MNRLINTLKQCFFQIINFLDLRFNIVLKYLKIVQKFNKNSDYQSYISWYQRSSVEAKLNEKFNLAYINHDSKLFNYIPQEGITYNLCLAAIENDSNLLSSVPLDYKTQELCELAIKKCNNNLLRPVIGCVPMKFRTYDFCLTAVKVDPGSLEFVPSNIIDYSMCLQAIAYDGEMMEYVPDRFKTEELNLLAVKQTWKAIRHIEEQTLEMCEIAVAENPYAFSHIKNQKHKTVDLALKVIETKECYKIIDICPNFDYRSTVINLTAMKAKENEIKDNKLLISETIKGLD